MDRMLTLNLTYKFAYNLLMMFSFGTVDLDHVICLFIVRLFSYAIIKVLSVGVFNNGKQRIN